MKAAVQEKFASYSLNINEVEKPKIHDDEVLIEVHSSSINPVDWQTAKALSYTAKLCRKKPIVLGHDLSGKVVSVGSKVTKFKIGDSVFGTNGLAIYSLRSLKSNKGSFAEFSAVNENKLAHKPECLSFEEAASVPLVALTAYQGLAKAQHLKNQRLLVIGGSGGVGSMVVQIAKAQGAQVTAVCSTKNIDFVKSLGADHVIDYTQEDYLNKNENYDIVFNTIGHQSLATHSNLLGSGGDYIDCAAPSPLGLLGLVRRYLFTKSHRSSFFLYRSSGEDLARISAWIEAGKIKPVISERIDLLNINRGLELSKSGRMRGKIVVAISSLPRELTSSNS